MFENTSKKQEKVQDKVQEKVQKQQELNDKDCRELTDEELEQLTGGAQVVTTVTWQGSPVTVTHCVTFGDTLGEAED